MARLLLQHPDIDLNYQRHNRDNALRYACLAPANSLAIVQLLLAQERPRPLNVQDGHNIVFEMLLWQSKCKQIMQEPEMVLLLFAFGMTDREPSRGSAEYMHAENTTALFMRGQTARSMVCVAL